MVPLQPSFMLLLRLFQLLLDEISLLLLLRRFTTCPRNKLQDMLFYWFYHKWRLILLRLLLRRPLLFLFPFLVRMLLRHTLLLALLLRPSPLLP